MATRRPFLSTGRQAAQPHTHQPTPAASGRGRLRDSWLAVRDSTVIALPGPSEQLGSRWNFFAVFEAIEDGEYDLSGCVPAGEGVAEMRINPHAYPYGGVGPLIALAEAFGFTVLGVNECGEYQSREQRLG